MRHSKRIFGKTIAVAAVFGVIVSQLPMFAFAVDTTGYVTAAATRDAGPAPEFLGIGGVEESGQFVDPSNWVNWEQPKYELEATGVNVLPNPYFVNMVASPQIVPFAVYNSDGRTGAGAGPDTALAAYGSGDTTDDAIWDLLPDIIIGNDDNDPATASSYATSAAAAGLANGDPLYSPTSLAYGFVDNAGLINTMYSIADAADTIVTNEGKSLRYSGTAWSIAQDYERYIRGTQGYIFKRITNGLETRKTVAVITGYDGSTGLYTIAAPGPNGTASTNRYLETIENVATNYNQSVTPMTIDSAALKGAVAAASTSGGIDLVIVGGQGLSPDQDTITGQLYSDWEGTTYLQNNLYYVYDGYDNNFETDDDPSTVSPDARTAAMYGVIMNSVENAQNIGRILGYLYPNSVDQADYLAYYFDLFYHLNSANLIAALANSLENCVPNWDNRLVPDITYSAATSVSGTAYFHWDPSAWTAAGGGPYDKANVASQIAEGVDYIKNPPSGVAIPAALVPTAHLQGELGGPPTPPPAASKILPVGRIEQAETNWCWAASAEMIGKYIKPNSAVDQEAVVMDRVATITGGILGPWVQFLFAMIDAPPYNIAGIAPWAARGIELVSDDE
ncbi:MAG: hypothetical protein LBS91_07520, partial [Clostridiales Family XIII bacterium]|nr:hypothetical protein [Clostridiales Family XIII bacterium]